GAAYNTMQEVLFAPPAPADAPPEVAAPLAPAPAGAAAPATPDPRTLEYLAALGIDVAADAVREVKQLLFAPETVAAAGERARSGSAEANPLASEDVPSQMPLVFEARRLTINELDCA